MATVRWARKRGVKATEVGRSSVPTNRGRDAAALHGQVQEALVSGGAEGAIICSRIGNGWEPLFAIVHKEVKSLPASFALSDEATEELNRLSSQSKARSPSSRHLWGRAPG